MSGWSCPYFDEPNDSCRRLNSGCVPGRKGCVLPANLRFAVSPEQRLAAAKTSAEPKARGHSAEFCASVQLVPHTPSARQPLSMHENVQTWDDVCACEPEPRWRDLEYE